MIGPKDQKSADKELFEQKMILSMELNVLPEDDLIERFLQGEVIFVCVGESVCICMFTSFFLLVP